MINKYTVLRDTGEKEDKGWLFERSNSCEGTRERNLYTGDYSIIARDTDYYEQKLFVVERKGSVTEFAACISQTEKWDDFHQELVRMDEFLHPFVFCEFPFSLLVKYPVDSGIPRRLWPQVRTSPAFLLKRLFEIQLAHRARFLFVAGGGKLAAASLFKRITENVRPPAAAAGEG